MTIKERKDKILLAAVNEYIKTGEPVSSLHLASKYDFGISPAMIRWELLDLEEDGFLIHPYTSSGRTPTERAYRFFVDYLLKRELIKRERVGQLKKVEAMLLKLREIDKILQGFSDISRSHLIWFDEEDFSETHESSLSEALQLCDLDDVGEILNFIKFTEAVKDARREILDDFKNEDISVFIGAEFPYESERKILNFSLLGVEGNWPNFGKGAILMLGPQRMNYENNLVMLKKIKEFSS